MMEEPVPMSGAAPSSPRWQPLAAIDRRVLGVLAEKAKTTPDAYPMSLNAIVNGCNQKSNRAPAMQLEPEDVQESLDRLRELARRGDDRGPRPRDQVPALPLRMARGREARAIRHDRASAPRAQTEGELRGRASRMDPIADLPALRTLWPA